ncbi:prepilin peptidase [Micromonospora sp. NPDC051925]|uniref:prepilin peptidase n=1 Tax=Micromonospora sp. NPDC051925 TaxID=3364288 RepID=UPI0037C83A14
MVAVAVAAATIGAVASPTPALPAFWLFAVVGVGLTIVDVRCRRLPHRLTGVLWASSGLFFTVAVLTGSDVGQLIRAASAGIGTATVMLAVALALPGQLGLGDVVFAGAVAFNLGWLGWQTAVLGVVAGLLLQGAIVLVVKIRRTTNAIDTPTPMGPALAAGWFLAVVLAA